MVFWPWFRQRQRALMGLRSLPQVIIKQIAALTVRNSNSDVRIAIKTLYFWALQPQMPIREHFEKARRDLVIDVIRDLNDKNLLILQAILLSQGGFVKDIYRTYRKISVRFQEEPFSYVHFYSNLSYLQSLGLILLIATKVNRTYTNRIQLSFEPSLFSPIFQGRLC